MARPVSSKPTLSRTPAVAQLAFPKGELRREIMRRGLSQREFAVQAGLDSMTIVKAIQGKRLQPKSFGRILIALAANPAEIPASLVEQSA